MNEMVRKYSEYLISRETAKLKIDRRRKRRAAVEMSAGTNAEESDIKIETRSREANRSH